MILAARIAKWFCVAFFIGCAGVLIYSLIGPASDFDPVVWAILTATFAIQSVTWHFNMKTEISKRDRWLTLLAR